MTSTVFCQPLTQAQFALYGGIISTDVITDRTVVVNNGTALRTPEVVPTLNLYSEAPSQTPARAVLNVSLASPREVFPWKGDALPPDDGAKRVLRIKTMERHKFSTQSFIPMGSAVRYLAIVTDSGDDAPDITKLRGFIASDKQGVCYRPGVWHAPMSVLDNPVSFAVVQHVNGVTEEDCEFYHLDEEINIVF